MDELAEPLLLLGFALVKRIDGDIGQARDVILRRPHSSRVCGKVFDRIVLAGRLSGGRNSAMNSRASSRRLLSIVLRTR